MAQDKKYVIKRAMARLLGISFTKEVYHPDWLANPVLVPKKNIDWTHAKKILIRHAKKIPSGCPGSISLWTPQPVVSF
jgi:hypothetical protein